jgi:hypothetical protein
MNERDAARREMCKNNREWLEARGWGYLYEDEEDK